MYMSCWYSETGIKEPLNFVISQDKWSLLTGDLKMILQRLSQVNDEIHVLKAKTKFKSYPITVHV